MILWKNKTSYQYCPTSALYSSDRHRITVHAHRVWWWVPWIVNLTQPEITWEKGISRRGCLDQVNLQACLRWSLLIVLIEARTPTQNVGNAFSHSQIRGLGTRKALVPWPWLLLLSSSRDCCQYWVLQSGSSGFQHGRNTNSSPGILQASNVTLELLRHPAL